MASEPSEIPPPVAYILILLVMLPIWVGAGLAWSGFMMVFAGWGSAAAVAGGLRWGLTMWIVMGNFFAIGFSWRRSGEIPAPDRAAFRAALDRVCDKLRMKVRSETADGVALGPRRALVQFRLFEVRMEFSGDKAILSAPALSFGAIRKELERALEASPTAVP